MTYTVKEVIKITANSLIVAVDDRKQEIKIGMFLNGIEIKSLKRNQEDDNVDLYIKDNKKHISFNAGDTVEILAEQIKEESKVE